MALYTSSSVAVLEEDINRAVQRYHPTASSLACAYVTGILAQNTRIEVFSPENSSSSSSREGYASLVERKQWCVEHPCDYKDLGDACLIWLGLFYPRAETRGFVDYTSSLGAFSYQRFSSLYGSESDFPSLFTELASHFDAWGIVLTALSARHITDNQLITIFERHYRHPRKPYAVILKERGFLDRVTEISLS